MRDVKTVQNEVPPCDQPPSVHPPNPVNVQTANDSLRAQKHEIADAQNSSSKKVNQRAEDLKINELSINNDETDRRSIHERRAKDLKSNETVDPSRPQSALHDVPSTVHPSTVSEPSRKNSPNNVQRRSLSPGSSSDSGSDSEFDPLPKTQYGSVDHRFGLCLYTRIC